MESSKILTPPDTLEEGLPPVEGWRRTFLAFRNRNYRYFYAGQALSLIGTWARTTALGWLAFQTTHSEFMLGITFTVNSLPILLFSTYSGLLADRLPKIRIFTFTSWFSLLSSLLIALLFLKGNVSIGVLLAFSACWGLSTAFEMPARQSLIVELVGKKDLVNAIALNSAMVNSTRVIGYALGGILTSLGASCCFFLDASSYIAVLYAIHLIQLPPFVPRPSVKGFQQFLEGFRYLKKNPKVGRAVALLFVLSLGGWAYISQISAFVRVQLNMDSATYGWLLAMTGLGACVAALTVATMGAALVKERSLYIGAAIFSLSIILFGFQRAPVSAAFFLFFAGFGLVLFFSVGNSLIQTESPNELRGRLMGIWALVFGGGMPIGSFWMGVIAQKVGSGHALQAGGLFCALGAGTVYFLGRKSRRFTLTK
ncbi:MAG TPA: MFS transporter [bacterium]|jgi:MFS family permease|nr:MFS transporter [bacterium]